MKSLLTNLVSGKLSTYAAITLMFTYTFLLNRDFECSCEPQGRQCDLYQSLPFFIILLLILWTDKSFQRVCRYLCSYLCGKCKPQTKFCARCSSETTRNFWGCCKPQTEFCAECINETTRKVGVCNKPQTKFCAGYSSETTCNFWGSFILHILKAVLVGLLWVAFVLLEGDWYVCCKNDHSELQAPLACKAKAKANITEKERVIITDLKNDSRVIGGSILCGIVVVASLIPLCRKCFERHSDCYNRRFLYDELILEEEENVLKEIWRKLAKDQLTMEVEDKINTRQWGESFDVAVDQINASAIPTFKEQKLRIPLRGKQPRRNTNFLTI